uniref:Uncharacterized protein n=1 Tax=Arundo donax TaxID=35708 RepID=A0A0A9BP90_ARUDO
MLWKGISFSCSTGTNYKISYGVSSEELAVVPCLL